MLTSNYSIFICFLLLLFSCVEKQHGRQLHQPLLLQNVHDKTIEGLLITGDTADCITLNNCSNITIKNCRFQRSKKNGITILSSRNIRVINCFFDSLATGVYAVECRNIIVDHNQFKNMQGPFPRGQFVQFDEVNGGGSSISYNTGENFAGKSAPEDAINVYKSNGLPDSPIVVAGNRIRGGGPSKVGGGIMLGDNGGSFIVAKNNILVDPGQYGMAIASGHHIRILDNIIYGRKQPFTNVGLYIWNQYPSGCNMNEIRGNKVNFTNATKGASPGWNAGNCKHTNGWDQNMWNAHIDASVLPKKLLTED